MRSAILLALALAACAAPPPRTASVPLSPTPARDFTQLRPNRDQLPPAELSGLEMHDRRQRYTAFEADAVTTAAALWCRSAPAEEVSKVLTYLKTSPAEAGFMAEENKQKLLAEALAQEAGRPRTTARCTFVTDRYEATRQRAGVPRTLPLRPAAPGRTAPQDTGWQPAPGVPPPSLDEIKL